VRVALIGDVHGDLEELCARLLRAHRTWGVGAAIQLGDFGFEERVLGAGRGWPHFPVPLLALCGNHEDHEFLAWSGRAGHWRRWAERGLLYQPRGSVARLGGATIGFLGGAFHVDRPQEELNRPSALELERARRNFEVRRPDLIATHSCPAGIGVGMQANPQFVQGMADYVRKVGIDPGPQGDCGEPGLTELWQRLAHRPKLWAFGHFHQEHHAQVQGTHFFCVPSTRRDPRTLIWETRSGELTWRGEAASGAQGGE